MLGTTAALGAANKAAPNDASIGDFSFLVSGGVGTDEQRL
jgi:hypothetical protein